MAAPEAGHDGGHAVQRALGDVDAVDAGEIRARQQQMLVAEKHRVDAADRRQRQGGVLFAGPRRRLARNAGMAERDDEIDALGAQRRNVNARGFGDPDRRRAAAQMALVPLHDLRRREADHADAKALLRARLVAQRRLENEPGLEIERPSGRRMLQLRAGKFAPASATSRKSRP